MVKPRHLATTITLVVLCTNTACAKSFDSVAFCSAALDVSASTELQAQAIEEQNLEEVAFQSDRILSSSDRLELASGDMTRTVELLNEALREHQTRLLESDWTDGAVPEPSSAMSDLGAEVDARVQADCGIPFAYLPDPEVFAEGGPTTTTPPTTAPKRTTTTAAPDVRIATPEGVAFALMDLWSEESFDAERADAFAIDEVVEFLATVPWDGPKPTLYECNEVDFAMYCYFDWGGQEVTLSLDGDPVGYELGYGPAWYVTDVSFIGE